MKLTWRQFQSYLEAFQWMGGQCSEDGRRENATFDLQYTKDNPQLKEMKRREVEKAHAVLANIRERQKKKSALQ